MKRGRPRRNVRGAAEKDEEDNASTFSSSPGKEKENLSPISSRGRLSIDTHHQQFMTLLKDFDQNVALTRKDILTHYQVVTEELTLPFLTAIMKLPTQIKNMKWGEYLDMRESQSATSSVIPSIVVKSTDKDAHTFLVPGSSKHQLQTPALRSNAQLAKNRLPAITPKFDPSTPATISKRLPKPGEMLISLEGSPVSIPTSRPIRGASSLTTNEDLIALLNNPENLTKALKDKNTCKAFVKAYNTVKKMTE